MEDSMKDSVKCEDNIQSWSQAPDQSGFNHRIPTCQSTLSSSVYSDQTLEFHESVQSSQSEFVSELVSMQLPRNSIKENESHETSPVIGHKPSVSSDSGAYTDIESNAGDQGIDKGHTEEVSDSEYDKPPEPSIATNSTQMYYQSKKQRMAVLNNVEELKECAMSWEASHLEGVSYSSIDKEIPIKQDVEMDTQDPDSPMNSEEQDPIQKAELWVEKNATCLKKSECCSPVPTSGPLPDIQKLFNPTDSPLPQRHCYPSSPDPSRGYFSSSQSPLQSRHLSISTSGFSSPYSHTHSPGLSRNNSDASQYSHYASSYSYSSATSPGPLSPARFSPSQSPIPSRHHSSAQSPVVSRTRVEYLSQGYEAPTHHTLVLPCNTEHGSLPGNIPQPMSHPVSQGSNCSGANVYPIFPKIESNSEECSTSICKISQEPLHISQPGGIQFPHHTLPDSNSSDEVMRDHSDNSLGQAIDGSQHATFAAQAGISRQQLINSPCPICGDRISGFHYGIFSCESCKGFFKRTVQNKKNYLCLRGANCPVTIATRKKCPACRFERCIKMGMKLEAIREDRTRGGRSTYRCSYTLPNNLMAHVNSIDSNSSKPSSPHPSLGGDSRMDSSSNQDHLTNSSMGVTSVNVTVTSVGTSDSSNVPSSSISSNTLLEQIMSVEHLWHYNEEDMERLNIKTDTLDSSTPDPYSRLCDVADYRLYKIVKWCKSLPLFRNIQMDDQISLLSNAWCELLLFSCCYRSIPTPGEIRISQGKTVSLEQARALDLGPCIERMLTFTEHLRRLQVDQYEYVALKLIILLTSDNSGLKEPDRVRESQEKVLQVLQQYTLTHYPQLPSKFGELLLRIPELERLCQVNKDMLALKSKEGEIPSYHLLMDLLRGDH